MTRISKHLQGMAKPQNDRRGSLLIQMVVVMAGMSIVMTIVATILFRLFHHESIVLSSVAESGTAARMASVMRRDIHSANEANASAEGDSLTVQQTDGRIVWSLGKPGLILRRIIKTTDQRDPELIPGERFRVPHVKVKFSVSSPTDGSRAVVTFVAHAEADVKSKVPSRVNSKSFSTTVVACVGLTSMDPR
jgi:hypothetical protein